MSAWVCAVHKIQGLTLQKVVINFDLLKQNKFNHDQMHITLSRITSLNGFYVVGKFKDFAIRTDPGEAQIYHRLRTLKQLISIDIPVVSSGFFTFTLLNVYQNFFYNQSCDRFQRLAYCVKSSANISTHEEYFGRSFIVISKSTRNTLLKVLLLLYQKNSENLSLFYQNLTQINSVKFFEIIMSNFNVNALGQYSQISQILSNYVQIVTEPTHISGSFF